MLSFVRSATTLLLLLANVSAYGAETLREESLQPLSTEQIELGDPAGQEALLSPTIDITAGGFVSHLSRTNWELGSELLIFHNDYGSLDFNDKDGDHKVAGGIRFVFGWESDTRYGLRTRLTGIAGEGSAELISIEGFETPEGSVYRGFEYHGTSPTSDTSDSVELFASSWDFEFYKRIARSRTDLVVGAGLRSAMFQTTVPDLVENTILAGGVTLFTELRYVMYQGEQIELALVGSGRAAFLIGEWESKLSANFIEVETDMTITEGGLGLEWSRKLGPSVIALRTQYETQLWQSDVTSDLAFNGGAVRAGIFW